MDWRAWVEEIRLRGPGEDVWIPKSGASPSSVGFGRHLGSPRGQIRDWRLAMADGSGIHLREYPDHYEGHWDRRDPRTDLIGHLLLDCPTEARMAAAAIGSAKRGPAGLIAGWAVAEVLIALARASAKPAAANT